MKKLCLAATFLQVGHSAMYHCHCGEDMLYPWLSD